MKPYIIKIQYVLLAMALTSVVSSAQAQTTPSDTLLNRTVVVEQQYNPDIIDAQKINVVPRVQEITVSPRTVVYDNNLSPATSFPAEAMGIFAAKEVQQDATKGYARLGYGAYGNLDARAGYLFTPTSKDKINLFFGMDGRNGNLRMPYTEEKWKNHFYRTRANIAYTHQFNKMDMNIAGDFGLSNFNNAPLHLPRQKRFTSGAAHLGFLSTDADLPLQFNAETNVMLYSRQYNFVNDGSINETLIRTKVDVTGQINDEQSISVAGTMNNRLLGYDGYDNYTTLLLNPYYRMNHNNFKLHIGANLDFAFGFGKKVNVSPDIKADYLFSDSYILYLKATGGRILNDFRRLEMYNPHAELSSTQLDDSYEQLNAKIGFKASPVSGLWFNLYGGYQNIKNDLYTNFYRPESSYQNFVPNDFSNTTNTSNIFVGGDISYSYKDIIVLGANAKYQKWDADNQIAYLLKPEMTFGAQLDVKPFAGLNINANYQFIQRAKADNMDRLDAVSNLNIGASYELFNGISIFARATNLLNSKHSYYLNYIDQGTSFLGGLSFRF